MKSHEQFLQGLYKSLFTEICQRYPADRLDWDRDLSRLLQAAENHGLKTYTIFLPDICKALDRALADGYISQLSLPLTGVDKGRKSPRLFRGLFRRIFSADGLLLAEPDPDAIKLLRQLLLAAKKLKVECDESKTYKTVSEFFGIERETRRPSLKWEEDYLDIHDSKVPHLSDAVPIADGTPDLLLELVGSTVLSEPVSLLSHIQLVADIVAGSLGSFDPRDWSTKHGPGAVSDLGGEGFKYSFPNWPDRLASVFPIDEHAYANAGVWADEVISGEINSRFSSHEPPSKLIAVPKTQKGPRLIASEPTAHQWCQQAINEFLRKSLTRGPALLKESIHFRDQTFNQQAALRASRSMDAMTIDLSSASDRMSLWLVERMFRMNPTLLLGLHASRTRWLVNNIDKKSPRYSWLWKLAPQGAAFTFPMQSYIYSMIAISVLLWRAHISPSMRSIREASKYVQVFGDDIIVPLDCGLLTMEMLEYLGFKVNQQKSYGTGRFRESCGMDAWDGNDVTPAYVLRPPDRSRPESIVSCVAAHNNFAKKGLWHCADYLKSTLVQEAPHLRIPELPVDSGAFGWYSLLPNNSHLKRKWVEERSAMCVSVHLPKAKQTLRPMPGHWSLHQYFTDDPSPDDIWKAGSASKAKLHLKLSWVSLDHLG